MYKRIRDFREDNDLSQKEIAAELSIAQTTYSDYELGKVNIPVPTLKKLALLFGTSIDFLVELTDNPKPYPRGKDGQ